MARDRKRAKQRQQRRSEQSAHGEQRLPARARAGHEPDAAPEPLEDASGEVELAKASLARGAGEAALGLPDAPAGAPGALPEDGLVADDELDDVGRRGGGGARSGAELSREGNRFINFLRACWAELQRVQWPDRRQVAQATAVVLVFVVIAGGYLGLADFVFQRLVNAIL